MELLDFFVYFEPGSLYIAQAGLKPVGSKNNPE
jgi:hypothetical protein